MSGAPGSAAAFVAGRYVLLERLGAGAAGEVWSAEDPGIGRRVAVKLLRIPEGLGSALRKEWESRFLQEARAAGRLAHPGIVSIHDVGTASDGRPYIVMELVEGRTLDAVRQDASPPPLEQTIAWTIQVAEALDAAHRRGVIHRDIKPANILVGTDGRARIADFGIARVAESELTRDGAFVGSPAFAAPEQLCGATVDGRADLFALGAVFYLLATGRRPFDGKDVPSMVYAVCHLEPTAPSSRNPEISAAIDAVILRALRKTPDARFDSVADFARALQAAASGAEGVEKTVVEQPPGGSSAEARAVSIASATAVALIRAYRAVARATRFVAESSDAWLRRTAPRVKLGCASVASWARARAARMGGGRWWWLAAVAGVVVVAMLVGGVWSGRSEPERGGRTFERFMAAVGRKTSRVNLVVEHRLEAGAIEVREHGAVLLENALAAPEKHALGLPFVAYRSASQSATMRLAPGHHALEIAVTTPGGLDLHTSVDVQVDPRSEYDLHVSVATWPRKRLSVDWDHVAE